MKFEKDIFCKYLTLLREEKGLNKYEMSIQADIHYSYCLDIEKGKLTPNFRVLINIADALDTDISHLLGVKHYVKKDILKKDILKKDILAKLLKAQDDERTYEIALYQCLQKIAFFLLYHITIILSHSKSQQIFCQSFISQNYLLGWE